MFVLLCFDSFLSFVIVTTSKLVVDLILGLGGGGGGGVSIVVSIIKCTMGFLCVENNPQKTE